MTYFTFAGTLYGDSFEFSAETVSIDVTSAGSLRVVDHGRRTTTLLSLAEDQLAAVDTLNFHNGGRTALNLPGYNGGLLEDTLDNLLNDFGDGSPGTNSDVSTYIAAGNSYSGAVSAVSVQLGSQSYVFAARTSSQGVSTFRVGSDDSLTRVHTFTDTSATYAGQIGALATGVVGGNTFLFTGSAQEHGVSAFQISSSGELTAVTSLGVSELLPVQNITQIEPVSINGSLYLIVAASGSSSLSVLRVSATGALEVVDHVIDSLDTRFAQARVLTSIEVSDHVFIFTAGSDDGISLFTMMPDGRLLHLESIADTGPAALANVSAIEVVEVGGELQVFVTSGSEGGLSQFTIDLSVLGQVMQGSTNLVGTAQDDILQRASGSGSIDGGAGNDILMDGTGEDALTGGAGADVFVFIDDGRNDTIEDFGIGVDRIDLSFTSEVRAMSQITFTETSTGVIISYGSEQITLITANGTGLDADDFIFENFFDLTRVTVNASGSNPADGGNEAPVVNAANLTLFSGAWDNIGATLSASDADGDTIVTYEIRDASGTDSFWVGSGMVDASSGYQFSASQLSTLWVQGAATGGNQTLSIRAYDGTDWGDWENFTLTTVQNTLPELSIENLSAGASEWVNIGEMISYSDADGQAAVEYQVWDSIGGDSFWLAGTGVLEASAGTYFTGDRLPGLWVQGDSVGGTQTLWARAFDGAGWSEWVDFTFTTEVDNVAPTVTIGDIAAQPSAWVALGELMTYNDANGQAAVSYEIWDDSGADSFWVGDGIPDASSGYQFSASQIGAFWVQAEAEEGVQTLWIRAFDGTDWGAWDSFDFTTGEVNERPVVTIDALTVGASTRVHINDLVGYSDAEGESATQYEVWDSEGADSFGLDGVGNISATQGYVLTAAQLSDLWIEGEASGGTQTLWIRAHDGNSWGAWVDFETTTADGAQSDWFV
ncbi:calcium-binding protein [Cochlodiniinecator piscidefendens]|uniref:M10 family metallopeptidase C-terminal domain-containing protein n=1 Tax=Cochlodiniinecator piscidefendens TaxID=2715756 RepID=UPI00140B5AA5|nr:M10 family metallopeptidase C-terminal domain-containing protein [Cochlodiniinecator piscidefendens]